MNIRSILRTVCLIVAVVLIGCGDTEVSTKKDDRTRPFEGQWKFDAEGTFALMGKRINNDKAIQMAKQFHEKLRPLHANLTISGTTLTGDGLPSCEYQLFALHKHGNVLCGKAWHHEDRHDPGDMSKCFVQLELVDSKLKLTVKMLDGLPDLNDPDLHELLASSPAEGCKTPEQIKSNPNDWAIYLFDRK